MKHIAAIAVLVLAFFAFAGNSTVNAQATQKRLAATSKSFQVFYAKFRRAVLARDRATVASLTRFPFKYGYDAGDEGTYTRAQFLKQFNQLLGDRRTLFTKRNPSFYAGSEGYDLTDEYDATHFIFEKRGRSYQFVAYIAEP